MRRVALILALLALAACGADGAPEPRGGTLGGGSETASGGGGIILSGTATIGVDGSF